MKLNTPTWRCPNGKIIACTEKIKVMQENLEGLQQELQDVYEDALLMDIDSQQIKQFLITIINNLEDPYKGSNV